MANEITLAASTGQTLYALLRNSAAQLFSTAASAFEAYSVGHYAQYALALAEQGTTGFYVGSMPPAVSAAGRYSVQAKIQAGGTPAASDVGVGSGVLLWSGSAELDAYALPAVTVGAYASGLDPATQVLANTQNKVLCAAGGQVALDLTQAVPTTNNAQTLGDAFNAARAQGFGKWTLVGTTLRLYAADGATVVRLFTLDSANAPTQRT